jgi:sporulation-control protein spo0M
MGSCHPLIKFSEIKDQPLNLNMVDLELAKDYCLKLPEVEEYDDFGPPIV